MLWGSFWNYGLVQGLYVILKCLYGENKWECPSRTQAAGKACHGFAERFFVLISEIFHRPPGDGCRNADFDIISCKF